MKLIKRAFRFIFMIFYSRYLLVRKQIRVATTALLSRGTFLSRHSVVHSYTNIVDASIGYASYIGENCKLVKAHIGSYCSIAHNVEILHYTHPTSKFVSTHPAFFSLQRQSGVSYTAKQLFQEELFFDEKHNVSVKIGSDVWIGANVLIIAGLEIGDGAIVAAGSVVTKNVPPFSIVGGIPAKVIRSRFSNDQVEVLNTLKWWNKSPDWINKHIDVFGDIEVLMTSHKQNKLF